MHNILGTIIVYDFVSDRPPSDKSVSKGCRKQSKAIGLRQMLEAISNYKDGKEGKTAHIALTILHLRTVSWTNVSASLNPTVSRESDQLNAEASSGTDLKAVRAALDSNDITALNNVLTGQYFKVQNEQQTDYNKCIAS